MANFTFTQISNVDPNSGYNSFALTSINDAGTVTFEGFSDPYAPPSAILSGNGGNATPVTEINFDVAYQPSINNSGTTSFVGVSGVNPDFTPVYTSVYTSYNGQLTSLVDNSSVFSSFGLTSINNRGDVAFFANLDSGETGIFASYGGTITAIAQSSDDFSNFYPGLAGSALGRGDGPYGILSSTSINDFGTVAFSANLDTGSKGIFIGNQEGTKTIASIGSEFNTFGSANINNAGTVAFLAGLDADSNGQLESSGIYTYKNGEVTALFDTDNGIFSSFGSDAALNDKGMVAFLGTLNTGETGIFTGLDSTAGKVIAIGDELLGSTVTNLSMYQGGLNNEGQLAFKALLADGRETIVRAQPVPEPTDGIVSVLALAILFMLGWRWRNRKQFPKHAGR